MAQWTIIPAPTIALCDDLVTYIRQQWEPKAPAEVKRAHWQQRIWNPRKPTLGRQVRVMPLGYDSVVAARGQDFYTHRIGVLTFELYDDAASPEEGIPIDWIDDRVDFVHTLRDALDFMRDGVQPSFNRNLLTLTAPAEEIYDPEAIEDKLFWSWIEFGIQEQESI